MEHCEIFIGDCFQLVEEKIKDNSLDLIILDPPYNISKKFKLTRTNVKDLNLNFGKWDFFKAQKDNDNTDSVYIRSFLFPLLVLIHKKLKKTGTAYVFIADKYKAFLRHFWVYNLDAFYKGSYYWIKPNPAPKIHKRGYRSGVEEIAIIQKNKKEAKFNFLSQKECVNYMICPPPSIKKKKKIYNEENGEYVTHPTQKPEALIKRMINVSSNYGDLVADFMMGVGTIPACAKKLGRKSIGIEKKALYFKGSKKRLQSVPFLEVKSHNNLTKKTMDWFI